MGWMLYYCRYNKVLHYSYSQLREIILFYKIYIFKGVNSYIKIDRYRNWNRRSRIKKLKVKKD